MKKKPNSKHPWERLGWSKKCYDDVVKLGLTPTDDIGEIMKQFYDVVTESNFFDAADANCGFDGAALGYYVRSLFYEPYEDCFGRCDHCRHYRDDRDAIGDDTCEGDCLCHPGQRRTFSDDGCRDFSAHHKSVNLLKDACSKLGVIATMYRWATAERDADGCIVD